MAPSSRGAHCDARAWGTPRRRPPPPIAPLPPPQNVLDLMRDPAAYVEYHREVQRNDYIRIGPWHGADRSRRVAFLFSFRGPSWFKKAVGTETVKVRDQHFLGWETAGGGAGDAAFDAAAPAPLTKATLDCAPRLWMPGGRSPIKIADVRFQVTPAVGGVLLEAVVTATANESLKWIPGIGAALERIMLHQCEHMASTFVEYAQRVARERHAGLPPQPPTGPLPPVTLPAPLRELRHRELSLPGTPTGGEDGEGGARPSFGSSPPLPAARRRSAEAGPHALAHAPSATETVYLDALDSGLASPAASPRGAVPAARSLDRPATKGGGDLALAAQMGLSLAPVRTTSPRVGEAAWLAARARKAARGTVASPGGGILARSLRRLACLAPSRE